MCGCGTLQSATDEPSVCVRVCVRGCVFVHMHGFCCMLLDLCVFVHC